MSHDGKNSIAAALGVVVVVTVIAVIAAVAVMCSSDDIEERETKTDAVPPFSAPTGWSELEAGKPIRIDIDDPPGWTKGDQSLLWGPKFDGLTMHWSTSARDGWNVAVGRGESEDIDVDAQIWTAPGFPLAIVDLTAQLRGPALGDPLTATTSVAGLNGTVLSGSLRPHSTGEMDDDRDLLAARFDDVGPGVSMHSVAGATGHLQAPADDGERSIDWTIWPGVDVAPPCFDDAKHTTSLRLVVQFGDHPLVAPLPAPAEARSMGTPIFVDAPNVDGDVWADGRARNGRDFARRLRALAYGHSDRDDPRFGNGGLLAAEMGAVFVIPHQWWNEPSMADLRRSLAETEIEVVPTGDVDGRSPSSTRLVDGDDCPGIAGHHGDAQPDLFLVQYHTHNRPYEASITAPLSPVVEAGMVTSKRDELLDRVFAFNDGNALFATGAHRAFFIPLTATRNPLEDIASENLLTPNRDGHWTLHGALTRRLTSYEMATASRTHHSTSFEDLVAHRRQHGQAVPHWSPGGGFEYHHSPGDHLYFFGGKESVQVDEQTRPQSIWTWRYDDEAFIEYAGSVAPMNIALTKN